MIFWSSIPKLNSVDW